MTTERHPLDDLIHRLDITHDENSGVSANMLTVALGDALNEKNQHRLDGRISFSSVKKEIKRGHFSDWYIVIFIKLSEEGLSGKALNAYGQSSNHLPDDIFVENPNWRSDGVDETVRWLRAKPEFAEAMAIVEASLMKLDMDEVHLPPSRPGPRI